MTIPHPLQRLSGREADTTLTKGKAYEKSSNEGYPENHPEGKKEIYRHNVDYHSGRDHDDRIVGRM